MNRATWRRAAGCAGVLVMLMVIALAVLFLYQRRRRELVARHLGDPLAGQPVTLPPGPTAEAPRRVWLDTDAGCGLGERVDVDDCFALAVALDAPELDVRGIGTVFGNVALEEADSVTRELVALVRAQGGRVPDVHRGAAKRALRATDASDALARELTRAPLTVVAFGPLTNIAAALAAHPALVRNVTEIIMVAGKRPGQWMHPGYDHLITFSDFNVAKHPDAVRRVLAAGIPVTLVPFEASLEVTLSPAELDSIAAAGAVGRWLRDRSGEWLRFWRQEVGRDGFSPFDNAAVVYAIEPSLFRCVIAYGELETTPPWFGLGHTTELLVRGESGTGTRLRYCGRVNKGLQEFLITRLRAAAGGAVADR